MGVSQSRRKTMRGAGEPAIASRTYKGFSLADIVYRPGALEILAKPSRFGSNLSYPRVLTKEK